MSNGQGAGQANQEGSLGSGLDGQRSGARRVFNPMGPLENGMAAFQTVDDGSVKASFGASYMINKDQQAGDGVQDADALAGGSTDPTSNDTSVGYDMQVFAGPWSFLAEHLDRTKDIDQGLPDTDDDGWVGQVGVFVVPKKVELVARHSRVNFDVLDDVKETTLGFVYYVDKTNSKFTFDVSKVASSTSSDSDFKRARAQYQLIF